MDVIPQSQPAWIIWALAMGEASQAVRLQGEWKDEQMIDVYNPASMMLQANMSQRVIGVVRRGDGVQQLGLQWAR